MAGLPRTFRRNDGGRGPRRGGRGGGGASFGAGGPAGAPPPPPAPLVILGACHVALALLALLAWGVLWRRVRRNGLTRAVTWDCGYAAPTPRMQYTAGSFAGI